MEIHSVQDQSIQAQIDKLKQDHVKPKGPEPFADPIREFLRASKNASMARNWLTYPLEERKRIVRDMRFVPRRKGDEKMSVAAETDQEFEGRLLERWRTLCVIIQEESRAKPPTRSVEVAIAALKQLFYEHDFKVKPVTE